MKRKPEIDNSEPARAEAADVDSGAEQVSTDELLSRAAAIVRHDQNYSLHNGEALARLVNSGIITASDSVVTWRTGHLEHLANQFASDPQRTWRDYWDDLTIALTASKPEFDALVAAARGE